MNWSRASFSTALVGAALVAVLFAWLSGQADPTSRERHPSARPNCIPSPFGPADLIFCQEGGRAVAYQLRGGRRYFAGGVDPQSRSAKVRMR